MAAGPTTFAEAMQGVAGDLAKALLLPDANVQLGTQLLTQIVSVMNAPKPGPGGQPGMHPNGPGIPGGLGGQVPPPGGAPGALAGMPGPAGVGPANGQQPPNTDEMRRMLQSSPGGPG